MLILLLQRRGREGFDGDFDEESTMVEDSVSPSKLVFIYNHATVPFMFFL